MFGTWAAINDLSAFAFSFHLLTICLVCLYFLLLGILSPHQADTSRRINPGDWSSGPQQPQLQEMHLQMQSEALNEDILASGEGRLPTFAN